MTARQRHELLFLPGLTTAENLNLNAGRGVGMSIVRESLAAAGGTISIETWPQKGTTFSIRIPFPFADKEVCEAIYEPPIDMISYAGLSVLIVDDSPSVRLMMSRMIQKQGWCAHAAKNGIEALEKLAEMGEPPHVILSDIEMPRMGGYEFIAALRDDEMLKNIPVVFISSRSGDKNRDQALSAGAAEYVTKPYDEDGLVSLIDQLALTGRLVPDQ
jgi:CheY-like chemotaxis protein